MAEGLPRNWKADQAKGMAMDLMPTPMYNEQDRDLSLKRLRSLGALSQILVYPLLFALWESGRKGG
jgi:hypothetical protein